VDADLREMASLQQQARWSDARAVLQRAEARLDGNATGELHQRIGQARRDLDFVIELDRIRLHRLTSGNLPFYKARADQDYAKAFHDFGMADVSEAPEPVAARVRTSAVRVAVMAALDNWAACAAHERRDWLWAVARLADPDPHGWRDRVRNPALREDQEKLAELAEQAPMGGPSASLLLALAERLWTADGDAIPFLKQVQKHHPANFWANMVLGDAILRKEPVEAAGYYRAALAARPDAAVAYTALGDSLRLQKRRDEALGYYRQALDIDPNYARGHNNLGIYYRETRQIDTAIACYRRALEIDPNYAWAHFDLANTLRDAGRPDEALEHYCQFNAIDPSIPYVANIVRSDLVRRGRGEEVRREWQKALEQDPPKHDAWFGYAELCLFLGNEDEYRRARQDLLRRFGDTDDPNIAEKAARACLLLPATEEELRAAVALADRALAANATTSKWVYQYFLFAKGLAEYRQGRLDSAISIMNAKANRVMGPCPRLVIAMAKYRLGDKQTARSLLAAEIEAVDWQVRSHDQWIWHVLRREAEGLLNAGVENGQRPYVSPRPAQ
jgi:serine/threonine-protein kinase